MHEMQRVDRDNYVVVDEGAMLPGVAPVFAIMEDHADGSFSSYDISSVMHYAGTVCNKLK